MVEPFDIYSDSFTVTLNPWGANLNLFVSDPQPAALENCQALGLGTVRMSNQCLKVMAYMLAQRLSRHEADNDINCDPPVNVLRQLGISEEDWGRFWERVGE